MKRCTRCGRANLPEGRFARDRSRGDGLQSWCRECHARWGRENRELVRELNRRWREANPAEFAAAKREWERANPEKIRAKNRRQYLRRRRLAASRAGR